MDSTVDASGVLQALREESERRAKRQRLYRIFLYFCAAPPLIILASGALGALAHIGPYAHRAFNFDDMLGTFGAFGLMGSYVGLSSRQKELTKEAAVLRDCAAIPFLVEALASADREIVAIAKDALSRTLPYLTPEQASELEIDWHAILSHIYSKDVALQLSTIESLRRIGGGEQLGYLDKLGEGDLPVGAGKVEEKVRVNALSASADLRMRLARTLIDGKSQEVTEARKELGLE